MKWFNNRRNCDFLGPYEMHERRRISKTASWSHWGPCFAIFTIHESTRPGVTALIAAFSTSQPLEREAREEKRARRCEKSGTRALCTRDRCNEPWIVDGTPINYSSHIKNHSDLFFTWPSPPSFLWWTTRMDLEDFSEFRLQKFDSKIQIIWIYETDLSNIYQVFWKIFGGFPLLKDVSPSRGFYYFVSGDKVGDEVG